MSEIAERIQFNARRSAEYCDGVVLSDASIDQIIQAETGYEKEIDALRSRIAELEKSAVVWHRYPEEKPEQGMTKSLWDIPVLTFSSLGYVFSGEYCSDSGFWRNNEKQENITHWAYLPVPPEEVSNDNDKG